MGYYYHRIYDLLSAFELIEIISISFNNLKNRKNKYFMKKLTVKLMIRN